MFNGDFHGHKMGGAGRWNKFNFQFTRPENLVPFAHHFMNVETFLKQRLICVAVIDKPDDAVPLTEALLAGGLNTIEVTFRTAGAAESIARIRRSLPTAIVGAGTLLTPDQVKQAVDAGSQFGVSPGLSEAVSKAAHDHQLPLFPGCIT